jgi:REP element-mobilizing transposase RayT
MRIRKRHVQLTLDQARRCSGTHGGWRPGAGRPRGRKDVEHGVRERFDARFPQHITLRIVDGMTIRKEWLRPVIHGAFRDSQRTDFRLIEFDILGNHLHLVAEAASSEALGSAMNGLEVRLARRLNKRLKRRGKLFVGRYHTRSLRNPTEVRNALRYVLLNVRHHAAQRGERLDPNWVDPFSSGPWFDGWDGTARYSTQMMVEVPRPTVGPTTWLLRVGWRRLGLLSIREVPGKHRQPIARGG